MISDRTTSAHSSKCLDLWRYLYRCHLSMYTMYRCWANKNSRPSWIQSNSLVPITVKLLKNFRKITRLFFYSRCPPVPSHSLVGGGARVPVSYGVRPLTTAVNVTSFFCKVGNADHSSRKRVKQCKKRKKSRFFGFSKKNVKKRKKNVPRCI